MISIYILWLLILILSIVLLKLLDLNKNFIICFLITLFIILFVLNLNSCIEAALNGAKLAFTAILPTIFPFSVICNLLIAYDGVNIYSKILGPLICKPLKLSKNCSFPLVASFLCGYPLGAKYSSDIYNLGYIDKNEYERLLNIASNAGPIFILGAVSIAMLNDIRYGYILLIANYLSSFIIGFLIKSKGTSYSHKNFSTPKSNMLNSFGSNLKTALENAINTTLNIFAFIILFSVIINIIKSTTLIKDAFLLLENLFNISNNLLYSIFLGSIEFTNGCKLISLLDLSINLKLSIISFILCFSGVSVFAQVSSIISKDNPNYKKYIFYKFLQGILGFIITYLFSKLLIHSIPTFNNLNNFYFYKNFITIYTIINLFLLSTLFISIILKKLHSS